MASPLQRRLKDREDGLALSVRQLVRVKRRINLLAAQQLAFSSLGLLIGAGGLLVIAAFLLSASHFLALGVVLAVLLVALLPLVAIRAWRRFAGLERAAAIVDQKAELNGRLSTILALAEKGADRPLWPFLVEDTAGRLDDFQPNRIEKHRISRSIYGFVAACLIASLAGLMTYSARRNQEALRKFLKNFTLQVDPSEIAPSDNPSDGGGAQVEADPETLRSLADRLEAANQNGHGGNRTAMDQLAHKAKDLASNLQDRLTGRQLRDTPEKVKIRLAEAMGDRPPENNEPGDSNPNPAREKGGHSSSNSGAGKSDRKPNSDDQQQADSNTDAGPADQNPPPNSPSAKAFNPGGPEGPGAGDEPVAGQHAGSSPEASGQTAGGGSDPDHLMGPPDAPSHKNENFEIMIDARLSDRSPIASAQPYVPPRVKTALSPYQHPDEPLDRGTVPAGDRETIRRVFER